jgi:hypothetical protein
VGTFFACFSPHYDCFGGFMVKQKTWSEVSADIQRDLKKIDPVDRLDSARSLQLCHFLLTRSVNGWGNLLNNINVMCELKDAELKDLYQRFRDIVIAFTNIDIHFLEKIRKTKPKDLGNLFDKKNKLVV